MAEFRGFGPKALAFFKALKFHQDKTWFDENRALYDSDVLEPMIALLDTLTVRFAKARIPLKANGNKSIFRIHRDVRFAKDKSPYKTHAGALLTRSGNKRRAGGGMENGLVYLHVDPEGCFMVAGYYMPEPADLLKLRKAIARDRGKDYRAMLSGLKRGKLALEGEHQGTRIPKGFEGLKGGPLDEAIRMKSFIVEERIPAKLIGKPELADAIVDFTRRARPLLEFGWAALD